MGDMDHSDVRAMLEDAAIEPQGLERLMAGDTPDAAMVAGHLAACPDCADELARLHRAVGVLRPAVRSVAPPELRERTLAYVAALGRPRGVPETGHAASPRPTSADTRASAPVPSLRTPAPATARRRPALGPLVGLAAALIVAVAGTGLVVNGGNQTAARRQAQEIEALGDVARWTFRIDRQPDARRVELASVTGAATTGSLVFSPTTRELVVVAENLPLPPAGHEYRCWIEVGGTRESIGKMFFGGDLAYWVGDVPEVSATAPGTQFGVSLVRLDGGDVPGEPVLVGSG